MLPVLFHFGSHAVPTHTFFIYLGVAVALGVFMLEARRRGRLDQSLLVIAAGGLLCGAIAAKLSTVWEYVATAPNPTLIGALVDGGKSFLGGLAGAYVGVILTKRLIGYRQHTGDMFAPAVALGMAVGRVGCFLTEQIGTTTSMPWGITVSPSLAAQIPNCPQCAFGAPLHPSFLYEIVFHLAIFAGLLAMRSRLREVPGELFKIYLLAYALFRFWVEFVRGNQVAWGGFTRPQLFLIPSTLLLLGYFVRQVRRGAYRAASARLPVPSSGVLEAEVRVT